MDRNISITLLNNAVYHRQAQSCALSDLLSGKKGFKDVCLRILGHANSAVCHGQHYGGTRFGAWVLSSEGYVQIHVYGLDDQISALWHGVACVHSQVHQNLLDLTAVRIHLSWLCMESSGNSDILANEPGQQRLGIIDYRIQTQHRRA